MACIRIVDSWLRSPASAPMHQRVVMVVAEAWAEQRVLMRAFASSPDQMRPTIVLHGTLLAIGPAGLDPGGPWGIHVEPPADGRAQELRDQLELAARRLFGSKGNPPRLADETPSFERKATNHWAPGTPRDLPSPAGYPAGSGSYYEPSAGASGSGHGHMAAAGHGHVPGFAPPPAYGPPPAPSFAPPPAPAYGPPPPAPSFAPPPAPSFAPPPAPSFAPPPAPAHGPPPPAPSFAPPPAPAHGPPPHAAGGGPLPPVPPPQLAPDPAPSPWNQAPVGPAPGPTPPRPGPTPPRPGSTTARGHVPGSGARMPEPRAGAPHEQPGQLMGYPMSPGHQLTTQERAVLDALSASATLSASQIARIANTADGVTWMTVLMAKLARSGLDVIVIAGHAGGEPTYALRR